jgi:hypothetical protein
MPLEMAQRIQKPRADFLHDSLETCQACELLPNRAELSPILKVFQEVATSHKYFELVIFFEGFYRPPIKPRLDLRIKLARVAYNDL